MGGQLDLACGPLFFQPVIYKKRGPCNFSLGSKCIRLSQDPLTSFPLGTVFTFPVSPSTGGNEMKRAWGREPALSFPLWKSPLTAARQAAGLEATTPPPPPVPVHLGQSEPCSSHFRNLTAYETNVCHPASSGRCLCSKLNSHISPDWLWASRKLHNNRCHGWRNRMKRKEKWDFSENESRLGDRWCWYNYLLMESALTWILCILYMEIYKYIL